jgi:hypothetical protein
MPGPAPKAAKQNVVLSAKPLGTPTAGVSPTTTPAAPADTTALSPHASGTPNNPGPRDEPVAGGNAAGTTPAPKGKGSGSPSSKPLR